MFDVLQTSVYKTWFTSIKDRTVRGRIAARIERVQLGNFGDAKSVGDGIHELRLAFGPGYRVYFMQRGARVLLLLCGGDKGSQSRDIVRAKQMASELEQESWE
jgi:putative addiction module killer protein